MLSLKTIEDAYQESLKAEEKMLRKQNQRNRGKSSVRGGGTTRPRFSNIRVKQEVQVVDHHKDETLMEGDLHPEEEAEEEKFNVIHVENGDICHGIFLIIN